MPVGVLVGVKVGRVEHGLGGEEVLSGSGARGVKSAAFWSVSKQPPPFLLTAIVAPEEGARPLPS
jgi:hypothetical protein